MILSIKSIFSTSGGLVYTAPLCHKFNHRLEEVSIAVFVHIQKYAHQMLKVMSKRRCIPLLNHKCEIFICARVSVTYVFTAKSIRDTTDIAEAHIMNLLRTCPRINPVYPTCLNQNMLYVE